MPVEMVVLGNSSTGRERLKTEHKPQTQLHVETHAIQEAGKGVVFEVWSDTIGVAIGVVLPTDRHGVIQVDTGRHRSVRPCRCTSSTQALKNCEETNSRGSDRTGLARLNEER